MVAVATAFENCRTQAISRSVSSGVAQQAIGWAMYAESRLPAAVASSGTRDDRAAVPEQDPLGHRRADLPAGLQERLDDRCP